MCDNTYIAMVLDAYHFLPIRILVSVPCGSTIIVQDHPGFDPAGVHHWTLAHQVRDVEEIHEGKLEIVIYLPADEILPLAFQTRPKLVEQDK